MNHGYTVVGPPLRPDVLPLSQATLLSRWHPGNFNVRRHLTKTNVRAAKDDRALKLVSRITCPCFLVPPVSAGGRGRRCGSGA